MSTIWVALLIIAFAVVPAAVLTRLHKRGEEKRLKQLLARFNDAGAKHYLSFTHQEVLKDKILGLDTHNLKLLVLPFDAEQEEVMIDLADVETCVVYKEYAPFIIGETKEIKPEQVLTQTGLNVVFANTSQSFLVAFYDSRTNAIYEIPELEKKAKDWKSLIAQLTTKATTRRA